MESNVGTTPPQTDATSAASPDGLKDKATQRAQSLVGRAQEQASSKIKGAQTEAAQTLTSLANTLHQSGTQLRNEQQGVAGDYIERAADGIEKVATYLQNTDAGEVVDSVERFARRRPELFIGGAFAIGLIAARFLKSSGSSVTVPRSRALVPMSDREVPISPVGDMSTDQP